MPAVRMPASSDRSTFTPLPGKCARGHQRMHDRLAGTVGPLAEGLEEFTPAAAVKEQLAQGPKRSFSATLDRIVEMLDQRRHRIVRQCSAESQQSVVPDLRKGTSREPLEQLCVFRSRCGLGGPRLRKRLQRTVLRIR